MVAELFNGDALRHCRYLVLETESFHTLSHHGKVQAADFAHNLSKMFEIFAVAHKSMFGCKVIPFKNEP